MSSAWRARPRFQRLRSHASSDRPLIEINIGNAAPGARFGFAMAAGFVVNLGSDCIAYFSVRKYVTTSLICAIGQAGDRLHLALAVLHCGGHFGHAQSLHGWIGRSLDAHRLGHARTGRAGGAMAGSALRFVGGFAGIGKGKVLARETARSASKGNESTLSL